MVTKKKLGRGGKERSRIGCKFDVNEPKLRSRRVGAQSIQGGRRIWLMPTCQPRMQTGDVSSEKHTATSRQDQPTNRKVARTPKLEHRAKCDQRANAHNSLDSKLKTKDDTCQPTLIATAATKKTAATFRAHRQSSQRESRGGRKTTLPTVLPTHIQGKIVTNQCQVMPQQRLVLALFKNTNAFSHPVNKLVSLRLSL